MKKTICLLIIIISVACTNKKDSTTPQEITQTTKQSAGVAVNTTVVTSQQFHAQVTANGIIEATNRSELRFKTNEQLDRVYVSNGQRVNQGATLANLDNQLLENQMENAQIALNNANQKLLEEKINFGYGKTRIDSIPENVQKTLFQLSGYQEAKNRLDNATILYEQTLLKAPFAGTVANIIVKEGNFITGAEVFCTLFTHDKLDVIFNVLESELAFLEINQKITLHPFANKEIVYSGIITEINPMVSREGLVRIKAKITNPDTTIFDGMNVRVFVNKPIDDVTVIPKEALVLRSNREVVFTVQNNLAKWNYVTIAQENNTHYAISESVKVGDTIIISNNMNLAHDADVIATFIEPAAEKK
ncbi:MAG: efflux RND transporter periplasmic adaptor subunit [Flavobacteriales bacterium]|nr:efflux RND transporter periplasmic adaptor subunit [Flavobacteriales bacterium]